MRIKIIVVFVLCVLSLQVNAQKYSKKQFSLFSYTYEIDEKIKSELSRYDNNVTYRPESGQTKVEAMLINGLYNMVTKTLEDTFKLFILPPYSLTPKAKYDVYGFPDVTIQKALKLCDTKYFLKIQAVIENDMFDIKGEKLPEGSFKPKITLKLFIYDKYGIVPLQEGEGIASAIEPVDLSAEFIAGLAFVDTKLVKKPGEESLKDIFNRAVLEAVAHLQYKKSKSSK